MITAKITIARVVPHCVQCGAAEPRFAHRTEVGTAFGYRCCASPNVLPGPLGIELVVVGHVEEHLLEHAPRLLAGDFEIEHIYPAEVWEASDPQSCGDTWPGELTDAEHHRAIDALVKAAEQGRKRTEADA